MDRELSDVREARPGARHPGRRNDRQRKSRNGRTRGSVQARLQTLCRVREDAAHDQLHRVHAENQRRRAFTNTQRLPGLARPRHRFVVKKFV
jgi:hypothetical protein